MISKQNKTPKEKKLLPKFREKDCQKRLSSTMKAVSAPTVSPFLCCSSPSLPFLPPSCAFSLSFCSSSSSSSSQASSLHRIHGQIFAPHAKRKQTISSPSSDPSQTQYDESLDQAFRESINQVRTLFPRIYLKSLLHRKCKERVKHFLHRKAHGNKAFFLLRGRALLLIYNKDSTFRSQI